MIPDLFSIFGFPLHSFGLMLVLAFLTASRLFALSLRRAGEDEAIVEPMMFWSVVGGIIGARLFFILSYPSDFLADPLGMLFGGAGFVFYGGFLGAFIACALVVKKRGRSVMRYADYVAPALALGYAVGRLGCQLSGDGDYGSESTLPWAMSYALGVVPTPLNLRVHPTPVYESIIALITMFGLLRLEQARYFSTAGAVFGVYLILSALSRFFVEIVRVEPRILGSFTQAQVISIVLLVIGIVLMGRKGNVAHPQNPRS